VFAIGIAITALGLVFAESRMLWGYWAERPSIAAGVSSASEVVAATALPPDKQPSGDYLGAVRASCQPLSNECREGRLLEPFGRKHLALISPAPEWAHAVWSSEQRDRSLPRGATPVEGLAIQFRFRNEQFVVLGYRTSQVANDRYIYSESLYRIRDRQLERMHSERFYCDVAGLEALNWRVLFGLNAAVCSVAAAIVALVRR
jgi:hypothetical protein